MGAQMVKEVASKSVILRNGATTATVLAQAIVTEDYRMWLQAQIQWI
jgi:chaperonin GroEL (HSP60 family)